MRTDSAGRLGEPPLPQSKRAPACAQTIGDPWIDAMRRGRFEEAWLVSDRVLDERRGTPCFHWPRHEQYLWDGTPLAGKRVLVRCYHGLGDTVQFVRYAPLLKELECTVIVWAQPVLLPLLRTAPGIDELLPLHDGVPEVEYDVDVEIMELAHVFRSTIETLPHDVPYLRPPAAQESVVAWDRHIPPANDSAGSGDPALHRYRVGVVWRSGGWDDRRSIPTASLAPLAKLPGIELSAFQQGDALTEWPAGWGVIASSDDVVELANRLTTLDLFITVDSFPAHLAGALGVRTWTLLHADPDWRWMQGRDDSPWYPTMCLWRQRRAGDWDEVIARIAEALA